MPGIPNDTDDNLFDGDRAALVALGKPGAAPPPTTGVITPERNWGGEGEIIHTYSEVIVRNPEGRVYINSESDGTEHGWIELTGE